MDFVMFCIFAFTGTSVQYLTHWDHHQYNETLLANDLSLNGDNIHWIGVGICFAAAVIGGLASGLGLAESVDLGCQVAGEKVGFRGFAGLTGKARDIVQKKSFIKS